MVSISSGDNSKNRWNNTVNLWEIKDNNDLSSQQQSLNSQFTNDLKKNGILPESHESFLFARSRDICKFGPQFHAYKCESIPTSYRSLLLDSLVVVQEFSLSCLLLAVHRMVVTYYSSSDRVYCEGQENDISCLQKNFEAAGPKQIIAMAFVSLILVIILLFSEVKEPNPPKKLSTSSLLSFIFELPNYHIITLLHRLTDASLIAAALRLLSAVLRTLTASYSLDTVMALSVFGMIIHFFSCDYMYANGYVPDKQIMKTNNSEQHYLKKKYSKRSVFYGGTVSLNSSLFSTTLLASRISSNVFSYAFVSFSVVIFAFYPTVRHTLSRRSTTGCTSPTTLMSKYHKYIFNY